jgi:branched-chain amino acid transport system substrate-binding protein
MKAKGETKVALVFQNDPYYTEFIDFFKKTAQAQGITIVSQDLINPGTSDFKTIFVKMKASGVNGVVFGMYDEQMVAGFLKDHKQIIPGISLFSNDVVRQLVESNNDYKSYLEGTTFVENATVPGNFVSKYKASFSTDPVLSASTAYDSIMILADTLKNGSKNPVEYIKSHSFKTVSLGNITFDSIGGVVTQNKQYQVKEVVGGIIK